jgi:TolB-like protein/class 3 adenylate cyclase/Flp pilus assembly protein TadD
MAAEVKKEIQLEIAHVLFIDIVGYSKLSINDQRAAIDELNQAVRTSEQFQKAEGAGRLIKIPTGDGMALVFYKSPEEPVECALEISRALKEHAKIQLRMGVHSGPVSGVIDVNGQANLAGAGLNMAQRVMDCGDAGHILLSKRVADDLGEYEHWRPLLHDLGECEVKHGMRLSIVNLHADEVGNPQLPKKFQALKKHRTRMRWAATTAALLVSAAIVVGIAMFSRNRVRSTLSVPEKSIAVLPFENLSEEKANAYFTDGVQDEILTTLAKVADLKVISRTSVMQFRDTAKRNLPEIAQALKVSHVLEGSVQRSANRVRVSAQLIDARTDTHLWAERYDRDLADVFAIQSEIAQKIVDQLQAVLTQNEQAALQAKPTNNLAAYDDYLRATEIDRLGGLASWEQRDQEVTLLEGAVARDPTFVPALCLLARTHLALYFYNRDHTDARLARAKKALDDAASLQPEAGEVYLTRAIFYYWGKRDYARALAELGNARRTLPNDADVPSFAGAIERRQGRWAESTRHFEEAVTKDPRNPGALVELASNNYVALRRYEDAARTLDSVLIWKPNDFDFEQERAFVDWAGRADLRRIERLLSGDTAKTADPDLLASTRIYLAFAQRDYRAAGEALSAYRQADLNWSGYVAPREWFEGVIARGLGDAQKAQRAFMTARERAAAAVANRPEDAKALIILAEIDAALGHKDDAVGEGEQAVTLLPVERDAMDGMLILLRLAGIYAQVSETARALDLLEYAAQTPCGVHYGDLKLREVWDPLRRDPRFEKIVASLAPKEKP